MNMHVLLVFFPVYHASSPLTESVCGVASLTHFSWHPSPVPPLAISHWIASS